MRSLLSRAVEEACLVVARQLHAICRYSNAPLAEINPKKKTVEKLKEDLRTDSSALLLPCWSSRPTATRESLSKSIGFGQSVADVCLCFAVGVAIYKNVPFMCSCGPVTSSVPSALVG